jgi:hypothetical protein
MLPPGLQFIDSWIDADRLDRCFQLMETDDRTTFGRGSPLERILPRSRSCRSWTVLRRPAEPAPRSGDSAIHRAEGSGPNHRPAVVRPRHNRSHDADAGEPFRGSMQRVSSRRCAQTSPTDLESTLFSASPDRAVARSRRPDRVPAGGTRVLFFLEECQLSAARVYLRLNAVNAGHAESAYPNEVACLQPATGRNNTSGAPHQPRGLPLKLARKLLALCTSVIMLLTFAPAVLATSNGPCVTPNGNHFLAGEWANNKVKRIKAHIDINDTNDILCSSGLTDTPDDGTFHGITLRPWIYESSHSKAQLFIGIAQCKAQITTEGCFTDGNDRRLWINNVSCVEPLALDFQYDLGPADESGEDVEIAWDSVNNEWDFYGDGGAYLMSFRVSNSNYACMNPEHKGSTGATNDEMQGAWQSERFDLGDGWGEVNPTHFTNMYYWEPGDILHTAGDGTVCDFNNHPQTPHSQSCAMQGGSTSMDTWTHY